MKIPKKPSSTTEMESIFVDRDVQRYGFQKHLTAIKNSGIGDGLLLIYSGVGGIGKTLLFEQFKKMADESKKNFVLYDFKSNTDMLAVLKTLRKNLGDRYRMDFPLFDKGCIYLAQKNGEFVSSEQKKKILMDTAAFRWFKRNLFIALNGLVLKNCSDYVTFVDKLTDKISDTIGESAAEDLKNFLLDAVDASAYLKSSTVSFAECVQKIFSGSVEFFILVKAFKPILNILESRIQKADEKARANGNELYGELLIELEDRKIEDDPAHIKELLPQLFAQDISYWLNYTETDLIVFLDTYEVLTGEELGSKKSIRLISDNRDVPVDWWIGELLAAERVMWVIASRYEITKIGEVSLKDIDAVERYTVDVLEKNWANKYLERLKVKDENLRKGIVKLTGGHPLYLTACSVTYHNIIEAGKVPRMSDFGKNKDKIIERALGSFDEPTRFLLQKLCILGRWTDELAAAAIFELNPNTYKRLISLFAEKEDMSTNDDELVIYNFSRTISAFMLPGLKQDTLFAPVFAKMRDGANEFFKKFFAENQQEYYESDGKPEIYFGMWSDIILRTTDKPEELMTLYRENLVPFEKYFDLSTQANCAEKFLAKVGDTETLPSAYFQHCLGVTRFFQYRVKEALELERAAYSKLQRLPIDDETRPLKIFVTIWLANIFRRLERWTDEINLREEIISECESYYPDADDERTIDAKENLARALEFGDRIDEAIEIRWQLVELLDENDNEVFIPALKNLAAALEKGNRYEEAISVRKNLVKFYEGIQDDEQLIDALWRLAWAWDGISDQKAIEEKLACYQKIFRIHEKNDMAIQPDLFVAIKDALKKLDRKDEAAKICKNFIDDLKRRVEACNEINEETFKLTASLSDMLGSILNKEIKPDESERWREKATEALNVIVEQICREPVKDYSAAISTLKSYSEFLNGQCHHEWQVMLWRKILALTEKNPAANDNEIFDAKKNLTDHLRKLIERRAKDEYFAEELRLFAEIEAHYKKIFPQNFDEFSDIDLLHQGHLLSIHFNDLPAAVAKRMEILDFVEKHPKATAKHIFDAMRKIAETFNHAKKYSDEAEWRERALIFCREHFMDDAPEILLTLSDLSSVYKTLKDYDKAEHYQKILVDLTEKKHGAEHSETLVEKERLARILHEAGKFDEEATLREQIDEAPTLLEDLDREFDDIMAAMKELLEIDSTTEEASLKAQDATERLIRWFNPVDKTLTK